MLSLLVTSTLSTQTSASVVVLVQQHFGLVKMPSGNFLIENYPVALQLGDMIIVLLSFVAVAWAVSLVATRTMIKNDMICEK